MKATFITLLLVSAMAFGQTNTTTNVKTTGNCSPVVTGNNNDFHFEYCGKDPDQEKKMVEILKAISESADKLNAVLEVIKPPNIRVTELPKEIPASPPKHPGWSINFFVDRADDNAQLGVVCDRACNPATLCTLPGPNSGVLGHLAESPNVAVFLFERQLPALMGCTITVESTDDKPIKVLGMKHLSITDARMIVQNPVQPPHCLMGSGSTLC
jgi:hypothetical protein